MFLFLCVHSLIDAIESPDNCLSEGRWRFTAVITLSCWMILLITTRPPIRQLAQPVRDRSEALAINGCVNTLTPYASG